MNQLAHIFLTYLAIAPFIPDERALLVPIAIFSILPDLDHIPGYVAWFRMSRAARKRRSLERVIDLFRTPVQEPVGIFTLIALLGALAWMGVDHPLLSIAAACLFLHWLIDFLTVHTRPLAPISQRTVVLWFDTTRKRIMSEVVITIASGVVFAIALVP